MSKKHGVQMFQKGDEAHLKAMKKMRELMQTLGAMEEWFEERWKEFESQP